jgi:serine/threonine-protein kinase
MQHRARNEDPYLSSSDSATHEIRNRLSVLDDYRPLLELGRGGMARVYLAEKRTRGLKRLVVLKVLDRELAESTEMRTLFRREAEICARLNHPNIVQIFEVFEDVSSPVIVMEYLEGLSLWKLLAKGEAPLPLRLHVHVLLQVLAGLHYFHELRDESAALSAVHRDVSPQNVIVVHEGAVKVLDFGIAKLQQPVDEATRAGIVKGKLNYMPPEQLLGDTTIDRRADVFAVGVMLWEAFAGRRLWQGLRQEEIARRLFAGNIPSIREACPDISPGWEHVIQTALAERREDRFESALAMQLAMETYLPELGGVVQQRELAAYMEAAHGESRRKRHRQVEEELKKPPVALANLLGEPVLSGMVEIDRLHETPIHQSRSVELGPPPRRARPLIFGALLIAIGASAGTFAFLASRTSPSEPALVAPRPVAVEITAKPQGAEIFLDGKRLGEGHFKGEVERSSSPRRLEVRAPGYESATRELRLENDTLLGIELVPTTPAETSEETGDAERGDASESAQRRRTRGVTRPLARASVPSAAPVVSAPSVAPAKANCSPPYVLDKDGVKTFKPECL